MPLELLNSHIKLQALAMRMSKKSKEMTCMFMYPLLGDPFYFYVEPNIFTNGLQHLKKILLWRNPTAKEANKALGR